MTKEITIVQDGVSYKIIIHKIKYSKYKEIRAAALGDVKVTGTVTTTSIKPFKLREMVMLAACEFPEGLKADDLYVENSEILEHEAMVENGLEEAEAGLFRNSQ